MSAMRKLLLSTSLLLLFALSGSAQQDPMFTKYMFNSLVFNPAYAGAKDYLSVTLLHRDQWWGIDGGINGAPKTQSFTIHSPLENDKVGLGMSIVRDEIGPTNTISAMGSYAYRMPLGAGKLCLGIQAGVMNYRSDFTKLTIQNLADQAFMNNMTPNMWIPNVGAGVHYYVPNKFYIGLSSPNLLQTTLRDGGRVGLDSAIAQQYRHYYLFAGGAIPINSSLVFKPSILIKNVGLFGEFQADNTVGAPTEFDIDLSVLIYDALWVGVAFRSAFEGFTGTSSFDSGDVWVSYYLRNGFRIGASYDYTLTELSSFAQGSYEIMLGYEMNYKLKQIETPRYF
jgi:type IX secretion system PorP/SprF family membrane protein